MIEQREITFDFETIMKGQSFNTSARFTLKHAVTCRLFLSGPAIPYHVHFPLARPSSDNLQAICSHSAHRPRYPQTYFPNSGYGQLKRRATAVNNAEFWFSDCCRQNATLGSEATLCCATQAWEHHIKLFCEEDSSVKDRLYECCRKRGGEQHDCFHDDAQNPNYDPTEERPVTPVASKDEFSFEPSTCPRNKQPPSSQNVSNFPLGRPTPDNIEALCQNKKLRPLYSVNCLAGPQNKLLAQQAKSINRMERGFKVCCKNKQEVLNCAEQKWREELDMFCEKIRTKKQKVHCCSLAQHHRFECFQDASPDPHYQMFSAKEELALNKLCEDHKLIKKKLPDALPLKAFVSQCCPLPIQNKTDCFEQRVRRVCSSKKKTSPAVSRCCRAAGVPGCLSKLFMHAVNKVAHIKKKKTCPLKI
uniref:Extracellular matrix protein 1b n=1 Tax=Takifugu rubripes TaxID=31033 RepID=A0A3B5KDV0_TAKRU